jgi:hypothetical protein
MKPNLAAQAFLIARFTLVVGAIVGPTSLSCAYADQGAIPAQIAALQQAVQMLQQQVGAQKTTITQLTAVVNSQSQLIGLLQQQNQDLQAKLGCMSKTGDDVYFTACNVHVVSGSGATDGAVNGRGNLIIGYNEDAASFPALPGITSGNNYPSQRGGSHNLIVGPGHSYTSYGGLVAGYVNSVTNIYSTVTGGAQNFASGKYSSVSGGGGNNATGNNTTGNFGGGDFSSVSGGIFNTASGILSSVSGGWLNKASSMYSTVSGGAFNAASGLASSVSGGAINTASVYASSVSGGAQSFASGEYSSISGGTLNHASGDFSSVNGGRENTASGKLSVVSGGKLNTASGCPSNCEDVASTVGGGRGNTAAGKFSSVSGGLNRTAPNDLNWAAGSLVESN